jgi:hypothetical protein
MDGFRRQHQLHALDRGVLGTVDDVLDCRLAMSKLLPDNPKMKILGMNNRWLFAIGNAAFFAIFEIFLAGTPAFIWVYPWWGAIPVFITTYIPFFLAAFLMHDAKPKTQLTFLSITWGLVALLLIVLIPAGVI